MRNGWKMIKTMIILMFNYYFLLSFLCLWMCRFNDNTGFWECNTMYSPFMDDGGLAGSCGIDFDIWMLLVISYVEFVVCLELFFGGMVYDAV